MSTAKKRSGSYPLRFPGRALAASGREGSLQRSSSEHSSVVRSESRFTEKMRCRCRRRRVDRLQRPVTGRDIVTVLAASPLTDGKLDRLTIKSRARNIDL